MVDDADYDWLNSFKWQVFNTGYAVRNYGGKLRLKQSMHRMILGLTDPKIKCDHKDRNRLNNCRGNLRVVTERQNSMNKSSAKGSSSKYLGVCWVKTRKKWVANIKMNNKTKFLGHFEKEVDAAIKYNEYATFLHGEYANLNKI